jgi:hypothetical protein
MPPAKRLAALHRAIEQGDGSVIESALSGASFVTGLSLTEREHLRASWAEKRHPDATARIRQLESDAAHLERGGKILQDFWLKCSSPKIVAWPSARKRQRPKPREREVSRFVQTGPSPRQDRERPARTNAAWQLGQAEGHNKGFEPRRQPAEAFGLTGKVVWQSGETGIGLAAAQRKAVPLFPSGEPRKVARLLPSAVLSVRAVCRLL